MPLPEKRYLPLDDLVKRWGTDLGNLRYYAEHKLLEIQVWLERRAVKVFESSEAKDGNIVWGEVGSTEHKGYVILDPDEIRKVFRLGKIRISKFTSVDKAQSYRIIEGKASYQIAIGDMVVSKAECERFEAAYDLQPEVPSTNATLDGPNHRKAPSFTGRPSVMYKIERQMRKRAAAGNMEPSLKRESEYLHSWAAQTISDHQIPRPGSIANALRHLYSKLKLREIA